MRMETAAILILRKVLDPDNPAHQAIIDSSHPPEEEEEGEAESPGTALQRNTEGSSRRGTKRKVKAEKGQSNKAIKPELSPVLRGNATAEIIDLTGF